MRPVALPPPAMGDADAKVKWCENIIAELCRATNIDKPADVANANAGMYQPLDSDLTAIAALTTATFGRSLLELANATALAALVDSFFLTPAEGNAAYQPLDATLTDLAALSDPNADSGLFWDDSTGSLDYWTPTGALSFNNTNLVVAGATDGNVGVVEGATDAEVYAAVADKFLDAALIESASAFVALSDAATVAVDWDAGINRSLTTTQNCTIGNPTNGQPGTWRTILVQGNNSTDRIISFGNQFLGEVPTITDCDDAKWYLISIFCVTTSHFIAAERVAKE